MKAHLFLLPVLLACGTAAQAQKISATEVPAAVQATFAARFPTVKSIRWEKESQPVKQVYEYETHNDFWARETYLTQEVYEASFRLGGQQRAVVITAAGLVQETETELSTKQLPPAVRASLARDFRACQVREAATISRADGSTWYEAELARAGKKQAVLFTADGRQAPE